MFIVPFTHKSKLLNNIHVTMFQILTIGGSALWNEASSNPTELLHSNGIYVLSKPVKIKDLYLCHVDTTKTQMSDFYKWNEISIDDQDTFCWRTFYTFGKEDGYYSWLPIPEQPTFGKYKYKDIFDMIISSVRT
jgi:hypothetical protein